MNSVRENTQAELAVDDAFAQMMVANLRLREMTGAFIAKVADAGQQPTSNIKPAEQQADKQAEIFAGFLEVQPADKPVDKPVKKLTVLPIEQPIEKPVGKVSDKPVEKPADQQIEKAAVQPAEQPEEQPEETGMNNAPIFQLSQ
jgi:hypothetical protein